MHWIEEKNVGHVTGKYTQIYAFYLKSFSICLLWGTPSR